MEIPSAVRVTAHMLWFGTNTGTALSGSSSRIGPGAGVVGVDDGLEAGDGLTDVVGETCGLGTIKGESAICNSLLA